MRMEDWKEFIEAETKEQKCKILKKGGWKKSNTLNLTFEDNEYHIMELLDIMSKKMGIELYYRGGNVKIIYDEDTLEP